MYEYIKGVIRTRESHDRHLNYTNKLQENSH